jgi:hypothetical protein
MSKRLNLTPQELQLIINSMADMKNFLTESANRLQRDTVNIKRTWDDDQFEIFEETVKDFIKNLNNMSERMESEKQRIIRYQQDAQRTSDNFNK